MRGLPLLCLAACGRLGFAPRESLVDGSSGADGTGVTGSSDGVSANAVELAVDGFGAITTSNGDACAAPCSATTTQPITLTAKPGEGWQFDHYSAPCGTAPTCDVSPGASITATFVMAPITANLVFVTTGAASVIGGLGLLDTLCQGEATAAGLSGTFVAFASTASTSARSRIASARGWVRVDGLPFLDQPTDLGDVTLPRGAGFEVSGTPIATEAITGSDASGNLASNLDCKNFTQQSAADASAGATSYFAGLGATGNSGASCAGDVPALCFEIDRSVAVTLHPSPFPAGRYLFISAQPFVMTGVAAADAQCQADAVAAGLPGNFVAMIATTTQSVSDRLGGLAGIWRRPDGIVITRTGLTATILDAAPNLDAQGGVSSAQPELYGAATPTDLGTPTSTCDDYASTATAGTQLGMNAADLTLLHDPGNTSLCAGANMMCAQL